MTIEEQNKIAKDFSDKFQEFSIDLSLTTDEFRLFDSGVFANSMDEKWNIFVLDNFMYWTRSWTDYCIYKILLNRQAGNVFLEKGFVTRDRTQYNSDNIEKDKILFFQLLQVYLGRDDFYVDPEFELNIIKEIISKYDPQNKCIKSIGHGNDVGLTKNIYDGLTTNSKDFCEVMGWDELKKNIATKNDEEELLSLYFQNNETRQGTTFYFDKEGEKLLGQVTITSRLSSS